MLISIETAEKEYKYLNDLTLARVRDTNFYWMTSMLLLTGVCALADKLEKWYIIIPGLLAVFPICYALAFNLDSIARARTYIHCILEPALGGCWDKLWLKRPLIKQSKLYRPMNVPVIFISLYLVMIIYMHMIAITHWPYGIVSYIVVFFPSTFPGLCGCFILYCSYSTSRWSQYKKGWLNNLTDSE